jgi:ElaB/YqjD/DUF883 family membrane-anchored ribosome-binding protein
MFLKKEAEPSNSLIDQAAQSADQVIKSTQQMAADALATLNGAMQDLRQQATPVAERALDSVRETSRQLRLKAEHASDNTVAYIKHDPVKSVLIAAATGAALMALVSLVSNARHRS